MTTLPVSDRARETAHDHAVMISRIPPVTYRDAFMRGEWDASVDVQTFARFEREITQSTADRVAELEAENARLRATLKDEQDRNQKLAKRNSQLSGAVEMQSPIGLDAGEWFYSEDDTSSDACRFSAGEVVWDAVEVMGEGDSQVVVIQRAVQLPEIYAAVHVFTEAEKDARDDDEDSAFTLHATLDEASAALKGDGDA